MQFVDKLYGKLIWIMTGVLFALAGSMMLISGSFNIERFYNVGAIHDVPQKELKLNANDTMSYDNERQTWVINSEKAVKTIPLSKGTWNYLYLPLSNVSSGSINTRVDFYTDMTLVYQMEATLSEGDNLMVLPGVECNRAELILNQQQNASFGIEDIQVRENMPIFSKDRAVSYFLVLICVFFVITGLIGLCIKKKSIRIAWYKLIFILQTLFLYIGNTGEQITANCTEKKKSFLRRGFFCFLLLLSQVSFILRLHKDLKIYRFVLLICVITILGIAFLSWEKQLKHLNWKNKLVASWLGLCICTMISDFVVDKEYAYVGYIMLFCFAFLFFMWGNMERKEQLLLDFIRGIEWSVVPNILFCYLFRPYMPGFRYLGGATMPGFFAMYLLFVEIALFTDLNLDIKHKKLRKKDAILFLGLGICADLIWKTQTVTVLLLAVMVALLFSFKIWLSRRKVGFFGIVLYLAIVVLGGALNDTCVYHVPRALHAEVKFKHDFYQDSVMENPFLIDVRAAEPGNDNRLLYKLKNSASLEELASGRTLYWKSYVRDLNLFGHKRRAYFLGARRYAHNGVLAIMHRYGIFAAVPYVMMLIYFVGYSWKYFKNNLHRNKYSFFVLANMLCCMALLLVENQELPFSWVCWYSMYIVMGVLFDDKTYIRR